MKFSTNIMIKSEKQAPHPTGTGVDEGQSSIYNCYIIE